MKFNLVFIKPNTSNHKISAVYHGRMWSPELLLLPKKVSMCLSVSVSLTTDLLFNTVMSPEGDLPLCDSFMSFCS